MAIVRMDKEIGTLKGTQISFQRVPPAFLKKKLAEQKEKETEQETETDGPLKKGYHPTRTGNIAELSSEPHR